VPLWLFNITQYWHYGMALSFEGIIHQNLTKSEAQGPGQVYDVNINNTY
jgi:hypothetical protein